MMIVGIDLHNIRDGGGVNYISNLLRATVPERDGIAEVHLFAAPDNLRNFPDAPFVVKHPLAALAKGLIHRVRASLKDIPRLARAAGCDIMYYPGGIAFGQSRPYATISRNMMPFRKDLWPLYPALSPEYARLQVLSRLNARTFTRSDGMIYLSDAARAAIEPTLAGGAQRTAVVAHGVDTSAFAPAAARRRPDADPGPIRLVYPSRFEPYKHQIEVLQAVHDLRAGGLDVSITFLGPANDRYHAAFAEARARLDPAGAFSDYRGSVPSASLAAIYAEHDLLVFASSCENLPNILIEAMATQIPVVSSDSPPMPDVLGDAALYFDPRRPDSLRQAITSALGDWDGTLQRARRGSERAAAYSWDRCARETWSLIRAAAQPAARA